MNHSILHLVRNTFALPALASLVIWAPSCLAWGPGGHMMVAKIAQDRLKPKAKTEAERLLAIPITPATISARSSDFVNASHWADDVKGLFSFSDTADLHFIDHPFSTDGTDLPADLPKPDNIVKALTDDVAILTNSSSADNDKAQALRYIIHFVGDIHQPLHCATKVSSNLQEGDRGGNDFLISEVDPSGHRKKVKLHAYWDGGITTFPKTGAKFQPPPVDEVLSAAAEIVSKVPEVSVTVSTGTPFDFDKWAEESFAIAQSSVYSTLKPGKQPSSDYDTKAVAILQQRVALAGYRLAVLLNAIWPENP